MKIINKNIDESIVNLILAIDSLPRPNFAKNNRLSISELSSKLLLAGLDNTSLEDKVNFIKLSSIFLNDAIHHKEINEKTLNKEEIDYIIYVSSN